jgi:hypothetical protein
MLVAGSRRRKQKPLPVTSSLSNFTRL